jgi:flagellar biosynthesis/type III secretory pathway chaperone
VSSLATEKLADLIDKRLRCLQQLHDLGQKQAALITTGEMGALLRLISTKNQLLAALQSIEQGLQPFHAQDPQQRSWSSPEARAHCAQQAAACQQLLEEVMQLERQNEQTMIARRDAVASQLQTAQAASAARGAYQAQQYPAGPHARHRPSAVPLPSAPGHQLDLHTDV